ncbi:hypothetical protein M404DRAFT_995085 [Pisolithus tinctorius Marx 270]|uniref:Uncharacterized protein n=1 Tax=Pisolithus tinctorius Marx 270 TaxID=870435 RepID=A0A0C3PCD3_PISTI|nr:hypothetical protein M404DRAFT_995085 [Pisolithus tinctorius Marx 270]
MVGYAPSLFLAMFATRYFHIEAKKLDPSGVRIPGWESRVSLLAREFAIITVETLLSQCLVTVLALLPSYRCEESCSYLADTIFGG